MAYQSPKNPATIKEQLSKLKERGCIIEDEEQAAQTLSYVNYYRLVHYFAIFLADKKHYKAGTTFNKVLKVYDFDRELRILCLSVLEELEINFRACVSNYHAIKYGALGYLNPSTFDYHHNHRAFLGKVERMIDSNMNENLVQHHIKKYGGQFPLWVMVEMFSFGTLNMFYVDMHSSDKKEIAASYGVNPNALENYFQCMSDCRNMCAHYNRLYGNDFEKIPRPVSFLPEREMSDSLFDYVLVMKQLYKRREFWNDNFLRKLGRLFYEYQENIDIGLLGFDENWNEILRFK